MSSKRITSLVLESIDKLPTSLRQIVFKAMTEIRYAKFSLRLANFRDADIPNPSMVYWISPKRIMHHTNYITNKDDPDKHSFAKRVFPPNMRGKVISGNWDLTNWKFDDLTVYKSFKKRIEEGADWRDTELYSSILKAVKSGKSPWRIKNRDDLDKRCKYLDTLIEAMRNNGILLNRNICSSKSTVPYDEIDVNIGRNGEYLFQNGVHRLSIAKILGIEYVPVMVFARHKEWHDFRKFLHSYAKQQATGRITQPLIHPDLSDIPSDGANGRELMKVISSHLEIKRGTMLDICANTGFFCHKFEDLGYKCYAIEKDPVAIQILERIKTAENKIFTIINESIIDTQLLKETSFDVVLALNPLGSFLKTETEFNKLKGLLRNLRMDVLFFAPPSNENGHVKYAYIDFNSTQFLEFILQNTSLTKFELIYTTKAGGSVFRLHK